MDPCDWPEAEVSSPSMGAQGARPHPLSYALRFQSGSQKQTLRANRQVPQYEPLPLVSDLNGRGQARGSERPNDPLNNQLSQVKSPKGKTDIHPSATKCNQVQPSEVHQRTLTSHLEGLISHPFIEYYCLMTASWLQRSGNPSRSKSGRKIPQSMVPLRGPKTQICRTRA